MSFQLFQSPTGAGVISLAMTSPLQSKTLKNPMASRKEKEKCPDFLRVKLFGQVSHLLLVVVFCFLLENDGKDGKKKEKSDETIENYCSVKGASSIRGF